MVAIVRTEWNGTSGGPGLTQLALRTTALNEWSNAESQAAVDIVRAFWQGLRTSFPDELTLTVSPIVDIYNEFTGDLVNSFTAGTAPAPVIGGGTSTYAGGVGAKVNWNTGVVRNGRRVRGHTYLVPIIGTAFTNTGTVASATQLAVTTVAETMRSALIATNHPLVVYSRPVTGEGARPGVITDVIGGVCGTKSAILRGRRD